MSLAFPDGKRFAFTILDDTDVATVANVKPIYDLLRAHRMRITKTVWPLRWPGKDSAFALSDTLEDRHYLEFVRQLAADGIEIASHGATMESSERPTTETALAILRDLLGTAPRVYANHSYNQENLYWGLERIDNPILKAIYGRLNGQPAYFYEGHRPGSRFFWGDLCLSNHEYVRNLTFSDLNVLRTNPSMPYHDATRPYVKLWFSAADAEDCPEFVELVTPERVDKLEADGGVCILATHLGKGFTRDGIVNAQFAAAIENLSARAGWFVPVGEILDFLRRSHGGADVLPRNEWRRMQMVWARDLVWRRLKKKLRRASR